MQGFNLVNTKNNMVIYLNWRDGFNSVFGTVEVKNERGSNTLETQDVTNFEIHHKDLMDNFDTKEKIEYHVNTDILKDIGETIEKIEKSEHSDDDKKWTASSHQEVIAKMDKYIRVIRAAYSVLYYYDTYTRDYKPLRNALTCQSYEINKFIFMTEKGYTLDKKKVETKNVYGTVRMFINDFCVNPLKFKNGISYDGICKCIRNIYGWISKIVRVYDILKVPEYYIISYNIPGIDDDDDDESNSPDILLMGNLISRIVQYPVNIISESCFSDAVVDQTMKTKGHCASWSDIVKVLDTYGF